MQPGIVEEVCGIFDASPPVARGSGIQGIPGLFRAYHSVHS
jgi:hypothetical protein